MKIKKPKKSRYQRVREHKQKREVGPCFHVDGDGSVCGLNGDEIFHCTTCEKLFEKGKREVEDVYRIQTCYVHREEALRQVKSHALKAHPVNILRVTIAALKGEEI